MLTLKRKFDMINAYSLAGSIMDGTFDDDYPIKERSMDVHPITGDRTYNDEVVCKYDEDQTLDLAKEYIQSTYSQHYANGNFQTLDLIESIGDAEAFCRSNAIKYLSRYNKKGRPQDDILKAVHYCLLLYYFSSK
jgi:hypothetical protein